MNDCLCGQECKKPCIFVSQIKAEQESVMEDKVKFYKAGYGCYLDMTEVAVKSTASMKNLERCVYEAGYQATEGWLGMHGFECECSEESEDGMYSEESGGDCCHQTVEEAANYWIKECTEAEYKEFGESLNGFEEW